MSEQRSISQKTITSFHLLKPKNEENLKIAMALIEPISVSIRVTRNFFLYKKGIFYDQEGGLGLGRTNHAVLLVGYGTDPIGGDYWLIKNSWGPHWGENGFARMSRNSELGCGVAIAPIYSVIWTFNESFLSYFWTRSMYLRNDQQLINMVN